MPHKIYRRGKIWHFSCTAAGRSFRRSTRTSDKELAKRIAAEAEASEWKRHLDGPGAHVTFAQAALAYLEAEKPTRFIAKIAGYWKETPIRQINAESIRQSAIKLYPNAKPATRNRQVIAPTAAIINHAAALEWCAPVKVRRFPVVVKTKQIITPAWAKQFAAHASPHLGALCIFMLGTGARIGQAIRLTWGDLNLTEATAQIAATRKNYTEHTAHLPPPVLAALANIGGNRDPSELVFGYADRGSATQPWKNAVKRAKLDHRSPHCCRHGFATLMLRAGQDVNTVAKLGGWHDPTVVLRSYGHAQEDRTLTNAIFDTKPAQSASVSRVKTRKQREIQ